jgi:hypothetical protein
MIMVAIGLLLQKQSKYEQVLSIFRKVLEPLQKVLGTTHPYTFSAMHGLAQTLQFFDEDIEAEK